MSFSMATLQKKNINGIQIYKYIYSLFIFISLRERDRERDIYIYRLDVFGCKCFIARFNVTDSKKLGNSKEWH